MLEDFSKHQQGIIKRFYASYDKIQLQKLSELVTELYLAQGKKLDKLWQQATTLMQKMELPEQRIAHITAKKDVVLLANLVKELSA